MFLLLKFRWWGWAWWQCGWKIFDIIKRIPLHSKKKRTGFQSFRYGKTKHTKICITEKFENASATEMNPFGINVLLICCLFDVWCGWQHLKYEHDTPHLFWKIMTNNLYMMNETKPTHGVVLRDVNVVWQMPLRSVQVFLCFIFHYYSLGPPCLFNGLIYAAAYTLINTEKRFR